MRPKKFGETKGLSVEPEPSKSRYGKSLRIEAQYSYDNLNPSEVRKLVEYCQRWLKEEKK